jgi:hypothetical protein
MLKSSLLQKLALAALLMPCISLLGAPQPPNGFVSLFNEHDLTGWVGGDTFDQRELKAMPEDKRAAKIAKWTATLTETNPKTGKPHWYVEGNELVNDGFGAFATTEKDYGDF